MLPQFLLLSAISLLTSAAATATATAESFTIYEVLSSHGLPTGLIPTGVNDFKYDQSGQFEFHLDRECNVKFDSELHYDRNVSGNLFYGQIAGLSGISAQDLFLWFPVKGIRVDVPSSGLIYFDVGVVSKQFSLALFETPRDCVAAETPDRVSKSVDMASFHINWIMVIFRVLFGRSGR